jgi:hypothetical protein
MEQDQRCWFLPVESREGYGGIGDRREERKIQERTKKGMKRTENDAVEGEESGEGISVQGHKRDLYSKRGV